MYLCDTVSIFLSSCCGYKSKFQTGGEWWYTLTMPCKKPDTQEVDRISQVVEAITRQ